MYIFRDIGVDIEIRVFAPEKIVPHGDLAPRPRSTPKQTTSKVREDPAFVHCLDLRRSTVMPRYRDNWLIDRVMFDYLSGGSCACCGLAYNLFLPNGTADLIAAMSDLESDQARREVASLNSPKNPWPKDLQDQVWADRVRLRQRMKKDMPSYATFWREHGKACRGLITTAHRAPTTTALLKRMFQVSRSEISLVLSERYSIHSAYGVVLCAALEQIAYFGLTEYEPDAPADSVEAEFESVLVFDKRRGFTLKHLGDMDPTDASKSDGTDALEVFLSRFDSLGGPTLLERPRRRRKNATDDDSDDDLDDAAADSAVTSTAVASEPGFQSDRRILRLFIARYFADQLMAKYEELARASSFDVADR
jgi:hypothetical protein